MSIVAIKDALVSAMSGSEAFGIGGAGTNYDVLETTSGSAVVISWTNLDVGGNGFGVVATNRVWTFSAEIYLKDEGNPAELMEKPFAAIDTIVNVLEGNPTLDGTAAGVTSIRAFHRPSKFREVIDVGGFIWQLFNIELDVLEWGGG